jgi:hypothetical protein
LRKIEKREKLNQQRNQTGGAETEVNTEKRGTPPSLSSSSSSDDEDMFNRLDRKLRRAYAELLATDIEIVPKHQKYQEAKIQFEEMLNL